MLRLTIRRRMSWIRPRSRRSIKSLSVAEAIDLYLHQDRSQLDLAIKERDQLRSEQDQRWRELQQVRSELTRLNEILRLQDLARIY